MTGSLTLELGWGLREPPYHTLYLESILYSVIVYPIPYLVGIIPCLVGSKPYLVGSMCGSIPYIILQGVYFTLGISLISPAINMLESWNIINWKGGMHSFVWSTKTFLYDIREQIKMGYQISKCLDIGQSYCLEI